MNTSVKLPFLIAIIAATAPGASADSNVRAPDHFKLIEPAASTVQNDRGDPQKTGPCGGSNTDWTTPTYIINEAVGGSMLHLKLEETIYHPGYYRVALAVNHQGELPKDPVAVTRETERGPWSVSGEVQDPPQIPVLADGLFMHRERPSEPQTFEADIPLPNINCDRCILQVIQFMEEHAFNNPGGYSYHHCADIRITADPSKPLDTGWPAQRSRS